MLTFNKDLLQNEILNEGMIYLRFIEKVIGRWETNVMTLEMNCNTDLILRITCGISLLYIVRKK